MRRFSVVRRDGKDMAAALAFRFGLFDVDQVVRIGALLDLGNVVVNRCPGHDGPGAAKGAFHGITWLVRTHRGPGILPPNRTDCPNGAITVLLSATFKLTESHLGII